MVGVEVVKETMSKYSLRQDPAIISLPFLFPPLSLSLTHTPPAVMMKMMMMKPNLKPNPQCMPNTLATVVHHTCKSNLQCIDDGDDDDHDGVGDDGDDDDDGEIP